MTSKKLATIIGIIASIFAILGGVYWYVARDVIAESQIQDNTNNLIDLWDKHDNEVSVIEDRITILKERASVNESRAEDVKNKVNKIDSQVDEMRMEQVEQRVQLENIEEDTEKIQDDLQLILRKLDDSE